MAQIYKRNGKWAYRVWYTDSQGNQHSTSKSGFIRKTDAQMEANELEIKKSTVGISKSETTTFADYFQEWIETYKLGKLSQNSQNRYLHIVKLIQKSFGNQLLKNISKLEYQKFLDNYGKTHAKKSTSKFNSSIRASLNDAIEEKLIYRDFTRGVVITGLQSKNANLKYLELDEAELLGKKTIKIPSMFNISAYMIYFALMTGCRFGEIAGLTWDCVDFENNTVNINKAYDYQGRTGFKATKTESSLRLISISNKLSQQLQKLKLEQKRLFLKQGFQNELNLVFINNRHEVPSSNGAKHVLQKLLKEVDNDLRTINPNRKRINMITMHGLRHTHASVLISKDISIDYISERLGHSDTSITARVYTHLLKDKREKENEKAINILENFN